MGFFFIILFFFNTTAIHFSLREDDCSILLPADFVLSVFYREINGSSACFRDYRNQVKRRPDHFQSHAARKMLE